MAERQCPVCGRHFFAKTGTHTYCSPAHRAQANTRRPGAKARYGGEHQRLRLKLGPQVATGTMPCVRCGFLIEPGELWDLDHAEDGSYRGPAHASCNRRAGAEKVNGRVTARPGTNGPPEAPWDEPVEDPAGGWWGPVSEMRGGRPIRPRWSRNWNA